MTKIVIDIDCEITHCFTCDKLSISLTTNNRYEECNVFIKEILNNLRCQECLDAEEKAKEKI